MNKHTPGQWTVRPTIIDHEPSEDYFDVVTRTEQVAAMIGVEADARLIAAAPELLEALVEAYRAYAHDEDGPCWADSTIRKTVAAIKKATDTKNSRFIG